jgi:hypothetical protein
VLLLGALLWFALRVEMRWIGFVLAALGSGAWLIAWLRRRRD